MVIDLENLIGLPQEFINRLKRFDKIFRLHKLIEHDETIDEIVIEINKFCLENRIIGYHYTNAIENDILEKGIISRTGEEIRKDFIKNHFHLFTKKEQSQILCQWKEQFDETDVEYRDNHIYFNFTKKAL